MKSKALLKSGELVPHKNVPGYPRLPTWAADSSGRVNADPQFMADKLAIVNHVHAYAYLIDEGRWDEWYELFSDDVEFDATVPLIGAVFAHDKRSLRGANRIRFVEPGKTSTAVRRHTMGNIHVCEQTENAAKVRTYMFISNMPGGDKLSIPTSGTYNAELEKHSGRWVITRWYIETDAFVAPSLGYPSEEYNFDIELSSLCTFPGHKGPAKPLPVKISLKSHGAWMPPHGALYKVANLATWSDIDVVIL